MTRTQTSLLAPADRWRPKGKGPVCGYVFRDVTCEKRGPHYCQPRADRVVAFFARMLVHPTGPFKRQAFHLRPFQEFEIIRPLFGEVVYNAKWRQYVRRYRIGYIVEGRKNGKSALVAGIILYLLVGDDEEGAEVYGAAKDTKQAGKVFQPASRMVQLSPKLNSRVVLNKHSRRLVDETSASYYEIITSDAEGELGHNPHGFVLDEVLSQPDDRLWTAMTTAAGARLQELMLAITTETDDPNSFGADLIDEAQQVAFDPTRAPHIFAYVRKLPRTEEELLELQHHYEGHPDLPVSTDVFDERNWKWANPALDDFLDRETLQRAADDAKLDARKENGFRQFRANQRVSQTTRWMPMHLWDAAIGEPWPTPDWGRLHLGILGGKRRTAWFGMDLAAKFDLTAWAVLVPDDDANLHALWRFWAPEDTLPELNEKVGDNRWTKWAQDGWLTVTEGNVVDYQRIYDDVAKDAKHFTLKAGDADQWSMAPVIQEVEKHAGVPEILAYANTYAAMTPGMNEVMALVKAGKLQHHGNPVARFCFDSVEVRHAPYDDDLIRPDKPERDKTGKRIDGVPALAMAAAARLRTINEQPKTRRVYGF